MKLSKYVFFITILCSILWAQGEEALAERIKRVNAELLEGYAQPLITAFGTGISTGLFHTAYSHDFLGFDLGVRGILVHIPNSAKYFTGKALICSLSTDGFVCDTIEIDSLSTVFGPKEATLVPTSGNAIAIPPEIPAGFGISYAPLVVPQLNIGLFRGSEVAIRYIPFTFKGSRVRFLGIGVKQELTRLFGFSPALKPVAIAIGGAYQDFSIKDSLGEQIAKSRTWNLQVLISKRVAVFEPFFGAGLEGTKVYFPYEFEFEIPDTISGIPTDRRTVTEKIDVKLHSQNQYRAMVGFTLKLEFFYVHYDYNITPYATHNVHLGISMR